MSQQNLGNIRYRNFITKYQDRFEQAGRRSEKSKIVAEAVETWKKGGGRFLQEYHFGFVEVPDEKARQKVAHSFRTLRSNQTRRLQSSQPGDADFKSSILSTKRSRSSEECSVGSAIDCVGI